MKLVKWVLILASFFFVVWIALRVLTAIAVLH